MICIHAHGSWIASLARGLGLAGALALAGCSIEEGPPLLVVARQEARPATRGAAPIAAASCPGLRSDLDGDGFADLLVGVPGEDLSGLTDVGAIAVLYGRASGLSTTGNQLLSPAGAGGAAGDRFGTAVTTGDFNGDCLADAAVGAPFDDVGAIGDAGSVHIFLGTASGLAATSAQVWHLDVTGIPGAAIAGDRFGAALASGDFDGDGFADLAIGNPHRKAPSPFGGPTIADVGSVVVLYGSATGLGTAGVQVWNQGAALGDSVELGDRFGWALAAGDFDGDGVDSLAVGSPGENSSSGSVYVIQGAASGLTATGSLLLTEGAFGIPDAPEGGEQFGYALASGDFDDDGRADLAIGVPYEDLTEDDAGAVTVVFGGPTGLVLGSGVESWSQNSPLVADISQSGDAFGAALDAGDFDGDGFVDLAVGVPGETLDTLLVTYLAAGAVNVLRGQATGLTGVASAFLHQQVAGMLGPPAMNEQLGQRVRAADFNGDAIADLAIAIPGEDSSSVADAGALHVLSGQPGGVSGIGSLRFSQSSTNVLDDCEVDDRFSGGL